VVGGWLGCGGLGDGKPGFVFFAYLMSDELQSEEMNPADVAYAEASRLAKEGDYAGALERHEWFHAHALEHKPAFQGVRLSFALGKWMELGRKYPPALKALKRVRDVGAERLRAGRICEGLFRDVVAINRTLGEDAETMTLFRKIEATDAVAAQRLFRFMIEVAMDAAPDLFLRYTPDLPGHFEWMSEQHEFVRQQIATTLAKRAGQADGGAYWVVRRREQLAKLDAGFLESAQQLVKLARDADQPEVAVRIEAAAEKLVKELQAATDAEVAPTVLVMRR
jgi:hypothetical protein